MKEILKFVWNDALATIIDSDPDAVINQLEDYGYIVTSND